MYTAAFPIFRVSSVFLYFAFKTKLPYYGKLLYCYGFRDGTAREREAFGLTYNKDIEGTPLEKKLIAALDDAASTYTEI